MIYPSAPGDPRQFAPDTRRSPSARTLHSIGGIIWQIARYGLATTAATAIAAIIPVLIASTPLFLAMGWVLLFVLHLTLGADSPLEFDEPLSIGLIPALLTVAGAVSVTAAAVATLGYGLLGILPASILTELVCWRLSIRSVVARLASFLGAGILLGLVATSVVVLLAEGRHIDLAPSVFSFVLAILTVNSVVSVFVSGVVLTSITGLKNAVSRWRHRRRDGGAGGTIDKPEDR